MTLIPANGISSRRFAAWMAQQNMNTINDLMEMGFIHPKNNREILLHPMIREVAVEELKPSVRSCSVLLDSLQEISLMHGLEFMNSRQVFHTVESIITTIRKDDTAKYLLFLENVFQYMDKYRYETGMQAVLDELSAILVDGSVGTSADRACLLDCRAALEKDTKKQLELVKEAIRVLGDVYPSNAHLAANLHANLGALYHKAGRTDLAKLYMEQGVQECNSDQCLDYGFIQQVMGNICVVKGDAAQAKLHHQRAMAIFELVFEDEPALLEEKHREIVQASLVSRRKNLKLLV